MFMLSEIGISITFAALLNFSWQLWRVMAPLGVSDVDDSSWM
jgi:hypothetical protein